MTAAFKVVKAESALATGSLGYGFCLDKGVTTSAEKGALKTIVNGKECDAGVTKRVCELLGVEAVIRQTADLPSGSGFGVSAAAAFSTALELNELFGLGLSTEKCGQTAHTAEVELLAGLGDVIAAFHGGFDLREKPGAPGIGVVKTQDIAADNVVVGTAGRIATKTVLGSDLERLNEFADRHITGFRPTTEYLCDSSLEFAHEIGIVDKELQAKIDSITGTGVKVGVAMLGKTLFSFDDAEAAFKKSLSNVTSCGINRGGPKNYS
ncbi:pantoate kinase [archaeon]